MSKHENDNGLEATFSSSDEDYKQKQSCKNCGVRDGFNFNVSDSMWKRVVPERLVNRVVCLTCFDRFAAERGIDYRRSLRVLYFAGRQVGFKFQVAWSAKGKQL